MAVISTGYGEGEKRVTKAIEDALNSPLLKNRDVYGSKTILVNIYYSRQAQQSFKMAEVDEMSRFMTNFSPEVDVIWGVAYDDTLDDKVKITILAAGFDVSLEVETPPKGQPKGPVKTDADEERKFKSSVRKPRYLCSNPKTSTTTKSSTSSKRHQPTTATRNSKAW